MRFTDLCYPTSYHINVFYKQKKGKELKHKQSIGIRIKYLFDFPKLVSSKLN